MQRYRVSFSSSQPVWPPIWAETLDDAKEIARRQYPTVIDLSVVEDDAPYTCAYCGQPLIVCRNALTEMDVDPTTGNYVMSSEPMSVQYVLHCTECSTYVPIAYGERITMNLMLEMAYVGGAVPRP